MIRISKENKLDILIALYMFCIIVSELMGGKTFPILSAGNFKLNASVSIFLLPLIFSINDIVVEVYGVERARHIVKTGLGLIVLLRLFSTLAVSLPPSIRFKTTDIAYHTIFGQSIRIAFASLTAFTLSDFLDIALFIKIRERLGKKALWFRTNVSNSGAQLIDTTVFMVLAFYSFDKPFAANSSFLISLILPYWFLKFSMSVIETPLVYIGIHWLKK